MRIFLLFWSLLTAVAPAVAVESNIVRVVYMQEAPPISWEENGKPQGLEPAVAEYCLSRLGLKAQHGFYPWLRANEMIRNGEADLIITTPTQARFEYALFGKGKAVIQNWSLFIHQDNQELIAKAKKFTRLEELKPYTFVDYRGNGWTSAYLKEGYKIHQVTRIEQLPEMIALKRGDFTIENPGVIKWWARQTGADKKIVEVKTNLPNTKFHYVFIVSRQSPWLAKGLLKGLDAALGEMKKSGEWARVMKQYGFPLETRDFKSQIQTEQFYLDYDSYPEFTPRP